MNEVEQPILETERLTMRPFEAGDLEWLMGHRSDDDVVRYIGGSELQTPNFIKRRLDFYMDCFENLGFSMCLTTLKETGEAVGVTGIQPLEKTDDVEVGYSFEADHWGKGLATESAEGWLRFGFDRAGLDKIFAVAMPDNEASVHVMKKLGMTFQDSVISYGLPVVRYAITREEFERVHSK